MKEQLYTIPLNDAVNAGDECPFCFIERSVEQDLLDFVLAELLLNLCGKHLLVAEEGDCHGFISLVIG